MLLQRVLRKTVAVSADVGNEVAKVKMHPRSTLNDLPSPKGNWKKKYDAQQAKYNTHLGMGVGTLLVTILFGVLTGMYDFHNSIPDEPADIDSYR